VKKFSSALQQESDHVCSKNPFSLIFVTNKYVIMQVIAATPTLIPCKGIANCVESLLKLFLTFKMVTFCLGTVLVYAYKCESEKSCSS